MSDTTNNPFESPKTDMKAAVNADSGELTALMKTYLEEASPWIRFVGIIGFIGCGLVALIGLFMLIGFTAFTQAISETMGYSGLMGIGIGAVYLIIAVAMFFPAQFTYNFGSGIKNYKQTGLNAKLESALKSNKSLWKFMGIMYIIYLSLIPVAIIASIIIGVISATM